MSSFLLKIVAIITMTIDHLGLIFFDNNLILRKIGRIAMPIFAFQIAVGFQKTHSKLKYIIRMCCLAIISQIPFSLLLSAANYPSNNLNICFTFTLALLTLYFINLGKKHKLFYLASIIPFLMSAFIPMDYGIYAILLVLVFYFFQGNKIMLTYGMIVIACTYNFIENNSTQVWMLLSLPFLYLYNGQKGKNLKYLFYIFYPLHLLVLALLRIYLDTIKI